MRKYGTVSKSKIPRAGICRVLDVYQIFFHTQFSYPSMHVVNISYIVSFSVQDLKMADLTNLVQTNISNLEEEDGQLQVQITGEVLVYK